MNLCLYVNHIFFKRGECMTKNTISSYTIGFFTTGTELEYSNLLTRAMDRAAAHHHINVVNFLGGTLNPNYSFSQYKFQYQCNAAFSYAHTPYIDGIILASGALSSFLNSDEFHQFYSQFKEKPIVSLGVKLDDIPSVYTDNKEVYRKLVSHLITVHHKRRIAFITGPDTNVDSLERYCGYLEALKAHDMPLIPGQVYTGDFILPCGKEAVAHFFDQYHLQLDAIVCANDAIALEVIDELKKRGISIPEEILVTGCDNIPSAIYSTPSLTSITQSIDKMADEALHLLLDVIQGKKTDSIIIPSKIIYRQSCPYSPKGPIVGTSEAWIPSEDQIASISSTFLKLCAKKMPTSQLEEVSSFMATCRELATSSTTLTYSSEMLSNQFILPLRSEKLPLNVLLQMKDFLFMFQDALMGTFINPHNIQCFNMTMAQVDQFIVNLILERHDSELVHMNQKLSLIRKFLLTITQNIGEKMQQLQSIIPLLAASGMNSCLIYLYPSGIVHTLSSPWQPPDEISLYMGFIDGKIMPSEALPLNVKTNEIIKFGLDSRDKIYTCYIHPIFFGNEQLGLCVFEQGYDDYSLIENLSVELACALKLSATFNAQRQVENRLAILSQTDELTGLLNRRGFFNLAEDQYAFSIACSRNGILFYADMDGLKHINDTYGHHEGDLAIIAMASILRQTFNKQAIIGRIGGDEFVILCTAKESSYIGIVCDTVKKLCYEHNQLSANPYLLSISIGSIYYYAEDKENLETLLSRADKLLYKEKRMKKELLREEKSTLI